MEKASVAAAERELEWATESWHAVRLAWEQELKETWADFSKIVDDTASEGIDKQRVIFSAFLGSKNPHTSRNLSIARRQWSAFLSHANRVFSKLQQGAKIGTSAPWYGTIIRARKEDPLLQYIHQARDAENHGDTTLDRDTVIQQVAPSVHLLMTAEALATGLGSAGASMNTPVLLLLTVKTRSGTYAPPTKHFHKEIRPTVEVVAETTLAYLSRIVRDAKSRVV